MLRKRRFSVLFFAVEVALLAALHSLSSGMVAEERERAAERNSRAARRGSVGSTHSVPETKRRYRRSSGVRTRQAPVKRLGPQEDARTPPQ